MENTSEKPDVSVSQDSNSNGIWIPRKRSNIVGKELLVRTVCGDKNERKTHVSISGVLSLKSGEKNP